MKKFVRIVESEIADNISADDPRAIRFRKDLKRVNAISMAARTMANMLRQKVSSGVPRTIVDLGSGDGTLMLSVARRLGPRWKGVTATMVDQQDIVSPQTREGFAAIDWKLQCVRSDIFDYLADLEPVDVMTATHFLHHFNDSSLTRLFELASKRTRLVVALEPRRTRFARETIRFLWLLGCGEVILRDAVTSVRSGFVSQEMSACWPQLGGWTTQENEVGLFLHSFIARLSYN